MNCLKTNKRKKNILIREHHGKAIQLAFIYLVLLHKIAFYFSIILFVYVDFVLFVEFMNFTFLLTVS